jgi:hypothetical protein
MSAMAAKLQLSTLGEVTIASIGGAGSTSAAHTNRDQGPPSSCGTLTQDGCIRASHRLSVGNIRIGALPAAVQLAAPAGFDYLIKLDGFTRTVSAEAGIGSANPSITTTGTMSLWNGVGYTPVNLATNTVGVTNLSVAATLGTVLGTTAVSITGTIQSGATSAPACPSSPCTDAKAEAASPIIGDLRYYVTVGGSPVVDLLIHIDFGTLLAHAQYTPSV